MTELDEEQPELTELVNGRFPRVDLVHKAANGVPRFLIAKDAGLMDPADIEDLIAKSEARVATDQDTVTITGSHASISKMIFDAAQVAKAEASGATINDHPDSDFAYIEPGGKKDDEGKTVPRSLRHFPIYDAAHVRNALSRAPQSPFGDKAMSAITAAAQKFDIEVSKAAGDEPLLEGTDDGIPGSVAWETVDSDTAMKWAGVLARAKNAVELLADREQEEGECTWDLEDTCAAIDCAISLLAPFAVSEQAEADRLDEAIAKAAQNLSVSDTLGTIEQLVPIKKAGRVLSATNEAKIRDAISSLQEVVMTLPAPTDDVAKAGATLSMSPHRPPGPTPDVNSATGSDADTPNDGHEVTPTSNTHDVSVPSDVKTLDGLAAAQGDLEGMNPVLQNDSVNPGEDGVMKAAALMAVYTQSGKLLGAIDPSKLTELQDGDGSDDAPEASAAAAAPAPADNTLAPAAPDTQGTPADQVAKSDEPSAIVKAAVEEAVTAALVAKEAESSQIIKGLEDRLAALEGPAPSRVLSSGALPSAAMLRGMDAGGEPADIAKAADVLRAELDRTVDTSRRASLEEALNALAITELTSMRANPQPVAMYSSPLLKD